MSKTWKITVDEYELRSLIDHHIMMLKSSNYDITRSHRIHDLTKRLNKKDDVEIEKEPEPVTENVKEVEVPAVWG